MTQCTDAERAEDLARQLTDRIAIISKVHKAAARALDQCHKDKTALFSAMVDIERDTS